jgi:hypothetical protein
MNQEVRLKLECYFDGELPADRHAEVAQLLSQDKEASLHVDRLARLRAMAGCHDRVALDQFVRPPAVRPRTARHQVWALAAAVAASVAAVMVWRDGPASDATGARNDGVVAVPVQFAQTEGPRIMTREVVLYTLANTAGRPPEPAARALLLNSTRLGKRPAVIEILALGLANATSDLAGKLEPLALLHKAPAGGRGNNERHGRRARSGRPSA